MIDKLLISLVFSIAICGFDVGATEVGDVSRGLKVFKKCPDKQPTSRTFVLSLISFFNSFEKAFATSICGRRPLDLCIDKLRYFLFSSLTSKHWLYFFLTFLVILFYFKF